MNYKKQGTWINWGDFIGTGKYNFLEYNDCIDFIRKYELTKNIKSSSEFTNMNRIQQDALAKSLGMSADDLANSLVNQAATRAGQQGSNRSFLGTSDVEQNRLNNIGQFRQSQYNNAVQ